MTGITNGPIDVLLQLRDSEDGPVGSTHAEDGVPIDFSKVGDFKVVFFVDDVDATTAGGWALSVESDSGLNFPSAVSLGSFANVEPGKYELPLSGAFVLAKDPTAAFIRCKATLTGMGSEISYGAYIAPAAH